MGLSFTLTHSLSPSLTLSPSPFHARKLISKAFRFCIFQIVFLNIEVMVLVGWLALVCCGMVLVWFWYGFGMVLVWFWYGFGMVLVWFWYGFGMVFLIFLVLVVLVVLVLVV